MLRNFSTADMRLLAMGLVKLEESLGKSSRVGGLTPEEGMDLAQSRHLRTQMGEPGIRATGTQERIIAETQLLAAFLCDKNAAYGDSALDPVAVFTKPLGFDTVESRANAGIRFRIDDKLSRLSRGKPFDGDSDDVLDLIGYLVLLRIAQGETTS